jgi:hypothetical protein
MTMNLFAIIPTMVLALSAATALANPAANSPAQFDRAGVIAASAAFVGDGSNPAYLRDQTQLRDEPGYSIGTGAVRLSGS